MTDGRGTRELRASGASEGALYGRTLPPERDGCWAECVASRFGSKGAKMQTLGDVGMAGERSTVARAAYVWAHSVCVYLFFESMHRHVFH
jgi:hypothetical protein